MGSSQRAKEPQEANRFQNEDGSTISSEYWIVLFFDHYGKQYNLYARVGSLINAVEDDFGYDEKPNYQVWRIDLAKEKVSIVGPPTWRPEP